MRVPGSRVKSLARQNKGKPNGNCTMRERKKNARTFRLKWPTHTHTYIYERWRKQKQSQSLLDESFFVYFCCFVLNAKRWTFVPSIVYIGCGFGVRERMGYHSTAFFYPIFRVGSVEDDMRGSYCTDCNTQVNRHNPRKNNAIRFESKQRCHVNFTRIDHVCTQHMHCTFWSNMWESAFVQQI